MKKNDSQAHLDLINAARAGDESAFEALLETYEPLIDSMSRSFVTVEDDSESVEDLRQEACIALYRALSFSEILWQQEDRFHNPNEEPTPQAHSWHSYRCGHDSSYR